MAVSIYFMVVICVYVRGSKQKRVRFRDNNSLAMDEDFYDGRLAITFQFCTLNLSFDFAHPTPT